MTATVRGIAVGNREGSANLDGDTEYSVVYYVRTDDRSDGPEKVRTAFGIPAIGDSYALGNDFDPRAVVTDKTARERESPFEWEVEVKYSTRKKEKEEPEENPLLQPAEISFGFQSRQIVIPGYYQDAQSPNPFKSMEVGVISSNGELFDPQPEMEVADPVLTIKKNIPYMSTQWLMSISNTVNITEFYGADPRQLRLMPPQTDRAFDKVVGFYWPTTFQFVYRYDTWDFQLLNIGSYYMSGGTRTPFRDYEQNPFIGLLTTDGNAINSSNVNTRGRYVSGGDAPTYTRMRIYREIEFNSLGII